MRAFLNCSTCSTSGWANVNEEQFAVCKICKSEFPIDAPIITAIDKDSK